MSRHATPTTTAGRRRLNLVVIAAGVAAAVVLALTFSGTLSAFTQAFLHQGNTVSTNSILIEETDADGVTSADCTSREAGKTTCTNPNLYSGQVLKPGDTSVTKSVFFTNKGTTVPSSVKLQGDPCSTSPTTGDALCDQVIVSMTWGGVAALPADITPRLLAADEFDVGTPPAAGKTVELRVSVKLPKDASADTSGVTLDQSLTFTFNS